MDLPCAVRLVIPILDAELILRHIDACKAIILEAGEESNASKESGQIIKIHQPGKTWNKGSSPTKLPFGGPGRVRSL